MCSRDYHKSPAPGEISYMLAGITAAENGCLQRRANALERELSGRSIKDPAAIAADLRAALQKEGLIRIRVKRLNYSCLWIDARIGPKLNRRLRQARTRRVDEICHACFTRAARELGLRPGIEDIYSKVAGQKVEGAVAIVPFAVMSTALDRMVERWRERRARVSVLSGAGKNRRRP